MYRPLDLPITDVIDLAKTSDKQCEPTKTSVYCRDNTDDDDNEDDDDSMTSDDAYDVADDFSDADDVT